MLPYDVTSPHNKLIHSIIDFHYEKDFQSKKPWKNADMPLLCVSTEISVFYTPSLCCLRILNYLRILLISLKKY